MTSYLHPGGTGTGSSSLQLMPHTPGAAAPLHTTSTDSLYLQVPHTPFSRQMHAQRGLQVDGQGWAWFQVWPHPCVPSRSAGESCCVSPAPAHGEGARDKLVLLMETSICPHSSATLPSPVSAQLVSWNTLHSPW